MANKWIIAELSTDWETVYRVPAPSIFPRPDRCLSLYAHVADLSRPCGAFSPTFIPYAFTRNLSRLLIARDERIKRYDGHPTHDGQNGQHDKDQGVITGLVHVPSNVRIDKSREYVG